MTAQCDELVIVPMRCDLVDGHPGDHHATLALTREEFEPALRVILDDAVTATRRAHRAWLLALLVTCASICVVLLYLVKVIS